MFLILLALCQHGKFMLVSRLLWLWKHPDLLLEYASVIPQVSEFVPICINKNKNKHKYKHKKIEIEMVEIDVLLDNDKYDQIVDDEFVIIEDIKSE